MKKLVSFLGFCILLQFLFVLGVKFPYQPSPYETAKLFFILLPQAEVRSAAFDSVVRVMAGFLSASLLGFILAIALAWKKSLAPYITPIIEIIRPIPPIAWIPIAILTFGIGNQAAYFIVLIGAFFPVFTNTYFGATQLPQVLQNTCKSYGIRGWKYVTSVLTYYTLPYTFTGLKIAAGMAWMSVIAAELAGVQGGLGYFIQYNRLLLRIDYVIVGMIYVGLLGALFVQIINIIQKYVITWQTRS